MSKNEKKEHPPVAIVEDVPTPAPVVSAKAVVDRAALAKVVAVLAEVCRLNNDPVSGLGSQAREALDGLVVES